MVRKILLILALGLALAGCAHYGYHDGYGPHGDSGCHYSYDRGYEHYGGCGYHRY